MVLIATSSLVVYFLFIRNVMLNRFNPGGEPFQIIGIFSNCNNNLHPSATNYYQTAQVCKKSMDWVMENKDFVANATELFHRTHKSGYFNRQRKWTVDNVIFLTYDICTQEEGVKLAVEILLNPNYFVNVTTPFPMWRDSYIMYGYKTPKILAVVLYTEAKITEQLLYILRLSIIPIYHLDPDWKLPVFFVKKIPQNKNIFQRRKLWNFYSRRMESLLIRKEISDFLIVQLGPQSLIYETFMHLLSNTNKYCYSNETIDVSDQYQLYYFLETLKGRNTPKHIFVFGCSKDQVKLFNAAIANGIVNRTWILHNIEAAYKDIVRIPKPTVVVTFFDKINQDLYFLEEMKPRTIIEEYVLERLERLEISKINFFETVLRCSRMMKRLFMTLIKHLDPKSLIEGYPTTILMEFLLKFKLGNFRVHDSKPMQLIAKSGDKFRRQLPIKYLQTLEYVYCNRPVCYKGWRNVYGQIPKLQSSQPWNLSTGWYCQNCPEHLHKDFIGDGRCTQCPHLTRPTLNRDKCYDPYRAIKSIEHWNVKFCIFICVVGGFLSVIIILTFIYNRETPFVRASNFKTALFHLILIGACFVIFPVIFFMEPTKTICSVRPFLVSLLNCPLIAVVFIKSNHILTIIQSNIRVSHGQMNKLKTFHFFIVFLFSGIGCVIAIVSLLKFPLDVQLSIDHISLTKELSCSSGFHVNLQIYYLLLLQILPAVQAFRGRNLPGPYNEAMLIVYATFTTIVCYLAMIPIYHFQPIESDKGTVQCCVVVAMNLVNLLLLYSKKTYDILFQSEKNTKKYIQSQIQDTTLFEMTST